MTTLILRNKAGAFVTRLQWRGAPLAINLLKPVRAVQYLTGPPLQMVPDRITYNRLAIIPPDTHIYVAAEKGGCPNAE